MPLDPGIAINFDKAYAKLEQDQSSDSRDHVIRESAKRFYHQLISSIDPEEHHMTWDTDPIFDSEMLAVRREDYLRYRNWAELELKAANDALQEYKFKLWDEQAETRKWQDLAEHMMRTRLPADKGKELTYDEIQRHIQKLRKSQIINEPIAESSPRRGESFDPNSPIAIPVDRTPSLWDNHQDKLTQHGVETSLISAALMQRTKNFRNMQLRAEKAEEAARRLGYEPLTARCLYYKGVALAGLEQGMEARQIFREAEPCKGRYEEGKWLRDWIAHTIALSPVRGEFSNSENVAMISERAKYADDTTPNGK